MLFKEFGDKRKPTIILLHGGGLSSWSVEPIKDLLVDRFHIITPVIDGHGEDYKNTFISINDSANKIITYIDDNLNKKIHCICGLSIGAQIALEVLSLRPNISHHSVIESALTIPIKFITKLMLPMIDMSFPLIKKRWYSNLQAKYLLLPKTMFKKYFNDSCNISKESLKNIITSNGYFQLRDDISKTYTNMLILYGCKELGVMKKSANKLHGLVKGSTLLPLPGYGHGELSQLNPDEYVSLLLNCISSD